MAMFPTAEGLIGHVMGGYRLQTLLGSGGAGAVFLGVKDEGEGEDEGEREGTEGGQGEGTQAVVQAAAQTPSQVAVKVLLPPPQASSEDRAEFGARFRREAAALAVLRHPHILALLDHGEDAQTGLPYLVLPYMRGGTLAARLAPGPLALDAAERLTTQVADALEYAHGQGVIHRDIKPGNVLLDEQGETYLADFGIAKIVSAEGTTLTTITSTGQVLGTAAYMAPEQAEGKEVGPAADVYSLGMVLYHMVTGRVPFEGTSLPQVFVQIIQTPPEPPRRLRPELPAPAEAAILRAVAKQPEGRFVTPGELARAFALGVKGEWAAGLQQPQTLDASAPNRTVTALPPDGGRKGRRTSLLIAGVAALVLVSIIGTLLLTGVLPARGGSKPPVANSGGATATATATLTSTTSGQSTPGTGKSPTATTGQSSSGGGGGTGQPTATATPTRTATPTPGPGTVTEFGIPTANSMPRGITRGPDGNLWFTEQNGNMIGRITPAGSITEFPIARASSQPYAITWGPDGNLWFTEANGNMIGRITPAGSITEFAIPTASSYPASIVSGSDGNLWFTEFQAGKIGRITTAGSVSEFTTGGQPSGITSGSDGNLWFTWGLQIGRITTTGSVTQFSSPESNGTWGITSGPDGNLWYTDEPNHIGRITPAGSVTEFPITSGSVPQGAITSGPNGNLWFTMTTTNQIGQISTLGSVTQFAITTANSSPYCITSGPDGNLWFTEGAADKIGRIMP